MNLAGVIRNFKNRKILVIGDLILDRYIWGKVDRISPEAPVPVVEVMRDNFLLGGAANVVNNITALGGRATAVGVVGRDRAGDILKELLKGQDADAGIFEDSRPTTIKTRVIAHNQQVVRFDRENRSRITGKLLHRLLDYIKDVISAHDAVILSDYKKGVVTPELIKAVIKLSGRRKFVAVDPKVGHFQFYSGVSLITPNLSEASLGSGVEIDNEEALVRAGTKLLSKLRLDAVLVTRGEEGMSLFEKNNIVHIPTVARKVYDVTGAGDTVISAFTLAYASGATMTEAAIIANHAAGIVVGEVGTAVATPPKLMQSLKALTPKGDI